MKRAITLVKLSVFLAFLLIVPAQAQRSLEKNSHEDTCSGPIFSSREVTQRATIISRKIPSMTPEALAHDVHGRVKLEAVLCRTGRVTDVRIIEGLPYGMTAKVVESVLTMKFKPAEMNWHTVSEKMGFEFDFNAVGGGSDEIPIERAASRLIDGIEIVGYRRLNREQILKWINTRPGDICSSLRLQRDLEAILKTGYFDKRRTRLFAEEGTQGRLLIVFETVELPLISEVKFEGLKYVSEKAILDALMKEKIDLREGTVDEPEKIENAQRLISDVLKLNGQSGATVEVRREHSTNFTVALSFVITGIN